MNKKSHPLFSVVGIELEYMLVHQGTLEIYPMADQLLTKIAGQLISEVELGEIAVSNEFVMHVIELKTNGPKANLTRLSEDFHQAIVHINKKLSHFSAQLMPTGAHPWMNPKDGVALWNHGDRSLYETYHRIFHCEGHGWSNLQSMHLNLPFSNEEEFLALHNAIRLVLPIIPALTASTPFIEGKLTGALDSRLTFYGGNQRKIPSISGQIIPEFIQTQAHYHSEILNPMYQAIAPFDTQNLLQEEWLNSRGAIARFDRSAIEIRIIDTQEAPVMDMACAIAVIAVLRHLIETGDAYQKAPLATETLRRIYDQAVQQGLQVVVEDKSFLAQLGLSTKRQYTLFQVWSELLEQASHYIDTTSEKMLEMILSQGNLSQRIIQSVQLSNNLRDTYQKLCQCLADNRPFT